MKTVGIPAINKRMRDIISTFGSRSEVYTKATSFIKANVKDDYIKYDASGDIMGIRQTKEAKADTKLFARPEALDEYLPTVESLFVREREAIKQEIEDKEYTGPEINTKASARKLRVDPILAPFITGRIESLFGDLNDFDSLKDEVYGVRDNTSLLDNTVYDERHFYDRAASLIDNLERTQTWVREARQLVAEYDDACQAQKIREIEAKYKK